MATAVSNRDIEEAASGSWKAKSNPAKHFNCPSVDEFEDLYTSYRPRVWALCLRMTGNPDEADDLTQETFTRIFQKLDTFKGESAFSTWLRRVAINVALLRFQKASWRRETAMEELSEPDNITGCPHKVEFGRADARLCEAIDRISLERAIEQLPHGFKTVLILHDIEGYEHVEISELTGCSVGTSKSQLHKARLKMRDLLGFAAIEEYVSRTSGASAKPRKQEGLDDAVLPFPPKGFREGLCTPAEAA